MRRHRFDEISLPYYVVVGGFGGKFNCFLPLLHLNFQLDRFRLLNKFATVLLQNLMVVLLEWYLVVYSLLVYLWHSIFGKDCLHLNLERDFLRGVTAHKIIGGSRTRDD